MSPKLDRGGLKPAASPALSESAGAEEWSPVRLESFGSVIACLPLLRAPPPCRTLIAVAIDYKVSLNPISMRQVLAKQICEPQVIVVAQLAAMDDIRRHRLYLVLKSIP
jgi:hypothetical protein